MSTQSTRLALRVDADLKTSRAAGYFEMDFGGTVPGNVAVSSTSYGFRIRQAWFDWSKGKFEITGGQLFSLMTPEKTDILPWPGDVATTQVIDTNYVAGLIWGRYPQVRLVYHYSKAASIGFSIENPEQQVGSGSASGVIFPTALVSTLNTQYNVGTNELKVPNVTPDFVVKLAFNGKLGGHTAHLDLGAYSESFATTLRTVGTVSPATTGRLAAVATQISASRSSRVSGWCWMGLPVPAPGAISAAWCPTLSYVPMAASRRLRPTRG